jgi:hypothetical protein
MVLGEVKRTFNPEFINRIDEIIVFEALTDDDLRRITRLLVEQLNDNLVDRRLHLDWRPRWSTGSSSSPARTARTAPAAAPRHPALHRGPAVGGAHPRPPARGRLRGLPRRGALAYRPAGQAAAGRRLA